MTLLKTAMKLKVMEAKLTEEIKNDINRILSHYLQHPADEIVITDIHSKLMSTIQEIAPNDFGVFFRVGSIQYSEEGVLEVNFEPTDLLIMKIIREYYESKA